MKAFIAWIPFALLLMIFGTEQINGLRERIVPQPQNDHLNSRDFSCPPGDLILPCVCSIDEDMNSEMDCSNVTSEMQLAEVFAKNLPVLHYYKLTVHNNQHLTVLRSRTLGNASYHQIRITEGVLQRVQHSALAGSYQTTTDLYLQHNNISFFPFEEISFFTVLKDFRINTNALNDFPVVVSSSLESLNLAANDFRDDTIDTDAMQQMPNLSDIYISFAGLTEISPGTYSRSPNLRSVNLYANELTHIPTGAIDVNMRINSKVSLWGNNISSVDVDAIKGVEWMILMYDNALTEVREEVWRPHLERGCQVWLRGNPLTCGCEIAWLVINRELIKYIDHDAKCTNGMNLIDLDPAVYEELC